MKQKPDWAERAVATYTRGLAISNYGAVELLRRERQRVWPLAKGNDKAGGWTYDFKFLNAIQDGCFRDEEEGLPSLEMVEQVLLALDKWCRQQAKGREEEG